MRYFLFFCLFNLIFVKISAQENLHYSQFYNSPIWLNPALCGQIGEDMYRVNAHARRQWTGVSDDVSGFLYETTSGGIDLSLLNKRLGVGLCFLHDKAGGGIYNTLQVMPTLSYSFIMGDNALTLGTQYKYVGNFLDNNSLRLPISEPFAPSVIYHELNAGINYKHDLYFMEINAGIAAMNLMQSKVRFSSTSVANSIPMQYKFYTNVDWDLTDKLKVLPGFFGVYQSGSTNFVFGSNLSYQYASGGTFGDRLILGLWGRTNNGNVESIIPGFGTRFDKFQLMATYDYNLGLSKGGSSNYFNGLTNTFEISIIFTGKPKVVPPLFEDDFILNPRY